jgi:hypothetical protein
MSYVVFSDTDRNSFVQGLALLFLVEESKLKITHEWGRNFINKKIEKMSVVDLIVEIISYRNNVNPILVVKFPKELKTDKHLISSYPSNYICTISSKVKKQNLLDIAHILRTMKYTEYIPHWFSPDIEDRKSRIEGIDLTDIETKELTQFSDTFRKQVEVWKDKRMVNLNMELDAIPNVLLRGF